MIYQLNYGIRYLGLAGMVMDMGYQKKTGTQIVRVPRTYEVLG
jgi:hypothetical protein